MFLGGQELDVGEACALQVLDQLRGQLAVAQHALGVVRWTAPGAQVAFIDRDRLIRCLDPGSPVDPTPILPVVRQIPDDGGVPWGGLAAERERVGLGHLVVVDDRLQAVLVERARLHPLDEAGPDAGVGHTLHLVSIRLPVVEVAHHRYAAGGGGPDGEGDTRHALDRAEVGAQLVVEPEMAPLGEQLQVLLRDPATGRGRPVFPLRRDAQRARIFLTLDHAGDSSIDASSYQTAP